MKQRLSSLRVRMLLPVIIMTLLVVIMLTTLFSRAYIDMILQQENEVNAVGFDTVSRTIPPLISSSVNEVRRIMADDRVTSYARLQYETDAQLVRARLRCRDYLKGEIARHKGITGLLFMRKDGSLFGVLPEGNFFLDEPEKSPLPEGVMEKILDVPLGQTVWVGPLAGSIISGYESTSDLSNYMIAAWKSVHVSYGECYALMLMAGSIFQEQVDTLRDGKSTWHLFSADQAEICHTGQEECLNPERLISESNSGTIFQNESNQPVCTFSMTMKSPAWTVVREVSMENYEQVVRRVRSSIILLGGAVFLIGLTLYWLWLKRRMPQFDSLLNGIIRMGEGDLETTEFEPTSINEFKRMQQEINKTSQALRQQMETIRQMERDRMELENKRKEQELILRELSTARQIQESMLPHIFPPFPDRREIELFASMDPARDVGGDFYDFFFLDEDHLCLVIADVSGKGIPGAMFMMFAKRIIEDSARQVHDPAEILSKTNETLCDSNQAEMFVTVWLGILEISTGKLTAANAGHEFPMLRRRGGRFELYKDRHGFVLGGMKEARYRSYELQIAPGDRLFVYTDGVPEATAANGEMFGTERTLAALNAGADGSPEDILKAVRSAVDAFVGDAEQFDDLTMMCLEYRGPQTTAPDGDGSD